jgi:hypothetical protein
MAGAFALIAAILSGILTGSPLIALVIMAGLVLLILAGGFLTQNRLPIDRYKGQRVRWHGGRIGIIVGLTGINTTKTEPHECPCVTVNRYLNGGRHLETVRVSDLRFTLAARLLYSWRPGEKVRGRR